MFKRFVALMCVLSVFCSLCACSMSDSAVIVPIEDMDVALPLSAPNYNNTAEGYGTFCVVGDTCFYEAYNSSLAGIAMYKDQQKAMLIPAEEIGETAFVDGVFAIGDRVYVSSWLESGEELFYTYDLSNHTYEHLLTLNDVYAWQVTEEYLAYTLYYGDAEGMYPLYVYDFAKQKKQLVSEEIESFGIVNGRVRYVVYDNAYHLYEYDPKTAKSQELCSFEGYSIKESVTYNFTQDYVVMIPWESNSYREEHEWMTCRVADGTANRYTLTKSELYSFVAGEHYAYALTYPISEETDSDSSVLQNVMQTVEENTGSLYRIDLATGAYEALPVDVDVSVYQIYVASDDMVYLLGYDVGPLSMRMNVMQYDVASGETGETWIL